MTKRYKPEIHEISMEEADKRMGSAGSIPFSPEEIDAMVRSATAGLHIVSGTQGPSGSPDMSPEQRDETDDFWQELMKKVSEADSAPDLTMEEAEARMAAADEAPFSEEEIASTVTSATETPSHLRVLGPDPAPAPRNFFLRHSSALTKVAALFLGMLMLYSVMGRSLVMPPDADGRRNSDWVAAVSQMLDPQETVSTRRRVLGTVFSAAEDGIHAIQEVRLEGDELGASAERYLETLRQALEATGIALDSQAVQLLGNPDNQEPGASSSAEERLVWLGLVAEQARYSILALRQAQAETEGEFHAMIGTLLERLARELPR